MRTRLARSLFGLTLFALASLPLHADQVMMARSPQAFPEAMLQLQELIGEQGYTVSRVQRVDIGLTQSGYQTDKYRVVFFGRAEEIKRLIADHPELVPYLPLKVAIFAEAENTMLVASNPALWERFFPDPELAPVFARWAGDLQAIFDAMRAGE